MQRSASCRSRREVSNAYLLAKFGIDTAGNEPCQVCPTELCSSQSGPANMASNGWRARRRPSPRGSRRRQWAIPPATSPASGFPSHAGHFVSRCLLFQVLRSMNLFLICRVCVFSSSLLQDCVTILCGLIRKNR